MGMNDGLLTEDKFKEDIKLFPQIRSMELNWSMNLPRKLCLIVYLL